MLVLGSVDIRLFPSCSGPPDSMKHQKKFGPNPSPGAAWKMFFFVGKTLPETNSKFTPEHRPKRPKREVVSQAPFFELLVSGSIYRLMHDDKNPISDHVKVGIASLKGS